MTKMESTNMRKDLWEHSVHDENRISQKYALERLYTVNCIGELTFEKLFPDAQHSLVGYKWVFSCFGYEFFQKSALACLYIWGGLN